MKPSPEPITDEHLLRQVADGDTDCFELVYDRFGRQAYSLAYRILGDQAAAEDATQDAFLAVWRNAKGYRLDRGSAAGWVLRIVRNRSIDLLRSRASKVPALDHDDDAALAQSPAQETTDSIAIERDQARQVRGLLRELPGDQSRVIELAFFGGFTQSEIAEMLSLPLGTVKGRMRLGLEKMRGGLVGGMA